MEFLEEIAKRAEEQGDLKRAFDAWDRLSANSEDPVHFCRLGYVARNLGMWDKAENAFLDALRVEPQLPEALQGLGIVYLYRPHSELSRDAAIATDYFARALELQPSAHGATLLGTAHAVRGNDEEARAAYARALLIDNNYEEAYYNMAKLEENANPTNAIELLETAIRIEPKYSLAHRELGRLYEDRGDFPRAEYHFRRSLEIDPTDYWSHLFLANLLAVQGKSAEAEATYRFVTTVHPEMKGGVEFFARFLDSIGRHQDATVLRATNK